MPRTLVTLLALATLSATAPLLRAQSANSAGPGNNTDLSYSDSANGGSSYTQPAAPIERSIAPDNGYPQQGSQGNSQLSRRPMNATSEPTHGVWLVTAPEASVQTVSATPDHTELRVEHGRANVDVHHPSDHSEILIDLPGGQVSLLKDGLYTFNAETNTVRVLQGEAEIASSNAKPVKVKENHQFTFGAQARSQDADPNQLRADLLQHNYGESDGYRHGDGYGYPGNGFAYGGYPGYGYGYPYYAFGGPFGYGYPYGYGYGLGLGIGYYGGFGYGGFRGGYGGFRGGYGGFRR